jgi:hypothetical protein
MIWYRVSPMSSYVEGRPAGNGAGDGCGAGVEAEWGENYAGGVEKGSEHNRLTDVKLVLTMPASVPRLLAIAEKRSTPRTPRNTPLAAIHDQVARAEDAEDCFHRQVTIPEKRRDICEPQEELPSSASSARGSGRSRRSVAYPRRPRRFQLLPSAERRAPSAERRAPSATRTDPRRTRRRPAPAARPPPLTPPPRRSRAPAGRRCASGRRRRPATAGRGRGR